MAYQKLQVQSALEVHLSDNANIPNTSSIPASGTTTGTTANKLVDSGETFESKVQVGDIVYNTSESNKAVMVIDFGADFSVSGGTFEIQFPTADSSNAILRIA